MGPVVALALSERARIAMHSRIILRNARTVESGASRNASHSTKNLVEICCPIKCSALFQFKMFVLLSLFSSKLFRNKTFLLEFCSAFFYFPRSSSNLFCSLLIKSIALLDPLFYIPALLLYFYISGIHILPRLYNLSKQL